MTIKILQCGEPTSDHLEQYKQYASVPDDSRDAMLMKMLKRAMLQVQAYSDRAMLPCTLEMIVTDVDAYSPIKLYQGGHEVLSVTDKFGNDVEYKDGIDRIYFTRGHDSLTVIYKNQVIIPDAEILLPVCWELATAIYDGEDTKVQGEILRKVYGML